MLVQELLVNTEENFVCPFCSEVHPDIPKSQASRYECCDPRVHSSLWLVYLEVCHPTQFQLVMQRRSQEATHA